MTEFLSVFVGPMAEPECRRAVGRGWVILVRTLGAVAVLAVALAVVWWWWVVSQSEPGHSPYLELRVGFGIVLSMTLVGAILLGPAVMAGSIAGEKERGAFALLLTTRVTPREIVTGRFLGKFSQVAMVVLAGAPALVILGSFAGYSLGVLTLAVALPLAVAFGGVGLATAASCLSRRGRDALLAVYLGEIMVLGAVHGLGGLAPASVAPWVAAVEPFSTVEPLAWQEDPAPALRCLLYWLGAGLAGVALASWRLRPACLAATARGERVRSASRWSWVPPVDEKRPMLWKELFIERAGTLGRFGTVVGCVLILALLGVTVALTAVILWPLTGGGSPEAAARATDALGDVVGNSGWLLCWLIQWSVGLRAAVSISGEREKGTWIGLLTSPLDAPQIVQGKLWGSLYALRWLIGAAFFAWVVAAGTGAISRTELAIWTAGVLVVGAFQAAVGVRTSLFCQTATRAMAITLGAWLGALVVVWFTTAILLLTGLLLCNLGWVVAAQLGLVPPRRRYGRRSRGQSGTRSCRTLLTRCSPC